MPKLSQETEYVQNPALGAMALWRFTVGYEKGSGENSPTPIPLLFIVLPVVMHEETAWFVTSTQKKSGLRKFAGKFSESKFRKSDILLSIHNRCVRLRRLTMDSLAIAISSKLMSLDCKDGLVVSLSSSAPKSGIPLTIEPLLRAAERLGIWCATVSLHEVSVILKVGF